MNKVARRRVSPCHVLPLAAVGVPLVEQVIHAILIEHAVGVVHPAIDRRMVVLRTVLLTVFRVEGVALLDFAPAQEVLHGTRKAAVAVELHVQQQLLGTEVLQLQRHIVIHLVNSQLGIERHDLLVIYQHLDGCNLLALLNRQQQEFLLYLHALHGVTLAQQLWSRLSLYQATRQCCHHGQKHFLYLHF